MTHGPVIEQVFQLKGHYIGHISTPVVTGVDKDDLVAPGPLHRHIMLSASTVEH